VCQPIRLVIPSRLAAGWMWYDITFDRQTGCWPRFLPTREHPSQRRSPRVGWSDTRRASPLSAALKTRYGPVFAVALTPRSLFLPLLLVVRFTPISRQKRFKAILRQAGLPLVRLYHLRHTAATLALSAGVPPKVVAEQLGHASAAFTLDVYSHLLPHMQADAAERVEALLYPSSGPVKTTSPNQRKPARSSR
jgi:integrase